MATSPRKSTVRFQERAELLDFLLEVSTATAETLDLDRIMANVATIVKEVIPYDLFAILLYSERQRTLSIRHSIGHREEVVKNLVLSLGEGLTGSAAATRQPILVGEVRKDPRYLPALDAVQAELAVPMLARGKLVGVIDLQSTHLGAYREQDRALLQLIASRVAVSIDNARLYRRVDRQNRTLKTLANLSQEFSSILDLNELQGKIAVTIHALVAFDAFSILLLDPDRKVLTHRFSERYDQRVAIDNIPLGKGITGAAAVSREIVRAAEEAVMRAIPSLDRRHLHTLVGLYQPAIPETPRVSIEGLAPALALFPSSRTAPSLDGIVLGDFVAPGVLDEAMGKPAVSQPPLPAPRVASTTRFQGAIALGAALTLALALALWRRSRRVV